MDRRTEQRLEKLKIAVRVAGVLNDARAQRVHHERGGRWTDADRVMNLVARPAALGREHGWSREVLTARRTSGEQVTIYFHGKTRTFRAKVTKGLKPASEQRPLLLDDIRVADGLVASCASCGKFYAKADGRMRFCSKSCA